MLAPSKETSVESHLPVPTSSQPVKILADMLQKLQIAGNTPDSNADTDSEGDIISENQRINAAGPSSTGTQSTITSTRCTRSTKTTTHLEILEKAVTALKKTNLAFLTTPTPTVAADPMPTTTTRTAQQTSVPVNVNIAAAALAIVPTTANELLLLAALRESQSQNIRTEVHAFELQASNILNEAYADRLCAKLGAQEEKRKKKKSTKLVGDGLPRLLSGDELEQVRRDAKDLAAVAFTKLVKTWEKKRDTTKARGTHFNTLKPKQDPVMKATPKPKLKDFLGAVVEDQEPKGSVDNTGEGEASASGSDGDDDDDDD